MINIGEDILLIIILYFVFSLLIINNSKEYINMVWHYATTVKGGHFEWITM